MIPRDAAGSRSSGSDAVSRSFPTGHRHVRRSASLYRDRDAAYDPPGVESTNAAPSSREVGSRIAVVIKYVVYFALPVHVTLLAVFAARGVTELAIFNVWSIAMWLGVWWANVRGRSRLAATLLNVEVSAHAIAAVSLLGLASGFQYYLVPIIALTVFHDQIRPRSAILGSASIVLLFAAMHYAFADTPMHPGWVALAVPFEALNIVTALAFVCVACGYFRFASIDIEHNLDALASSLERRVEEQVAEIVARADEVQSLNALLKAQVKARSDELAAALAQLAAKTDSGGLTPGTILDRRFEVGELVGQGGMGAVYAGVDRTTNRPVAIKVVRTRTSGDIATLRRFVREARAAASVEHPAVVRMLHVGLSDDGFLYQVQEFVAGITLERRLASPWEPASAARLGEVLFDALASAHAGGVIHRDVKTDNLMLTSTAPGLKLLDFGVAKLYDAVSGAAGATMTNTGHVIGTPAFMAPEQARGDTDVGDRADVYAAATVLYLLLAGRFPFERTGSPGWFLARAIEDAPNLRRFAPDTPEVLAELVMACLAREPGARPAAADAARTLAGFADERGAPRLEILAEAMRNAEDSPPLPGDLDTAERASAETRKP